MDLRELYASISAGLRAELAKTRSALEHRVSKGSVAEETVREQLRKLLPRSIDVSTGTLVDSTGNRSCQLDVVLSDSAKTPVFFDEGGIRLIPIECVYAAVEVKIDLTKQELVRTHENMTSVRNLQKRAYRPLPGPIENSENMYGSKWPIWPAMYFVFAYESATLKTLAEELQRLHFEAKSPPWRRIDTICVLSRGLIANQDGTTQQWNALPSPGSSLCHVETDHALLFFLTLVTHYLHQARLPLFDFTKYMPELQIRNTYRLPPI